MLYAEAFRVSTGEVADLTGQKIDRVNKFAEALSKQKLGTFFTTEGGKRRWSPEQVIRAEIAFGAADLDGKMGGMSAADLYVKLDSLDMLPEVIRDVFEPYPRGKTPECWTDRTKDLNVCLWFYGYPADETFPAQQWIGTAYGSLEQIARELSAKSPESTISQVYIFNVHDAVARVRARATDKGMIFPALREHLGRPELIEPQKFTMETK